VTPGLAERFREICDEVTSLGDRLHLRVAAPAQVEAAVRLAVGQGAEIVSVNPIRRSLEDYFFTEIQKS
jgi:hypothetical protein